MPRRIVLLDTSFIIALSTLKDKHHEAAIRLDAELLEQDAELVLHAGIVLEIADGFARAGLRQIGFELLERFDSENRYRFVPISEEIWERAVALYRDRPDKEWGLTDCISFVLMTQETITETLTADIHFRQAGFKALLLEAP